MECKEFEVWKPYIDAQIVQFIWSILTNYCMRYHVVSEIQKHEKTSEKVWKTHYVSHNQSNNLVPWSHFKQLSDISRKVA